MKDLSQIDIVDMKPSSRKVKVVGHSGRHQGSNSKMFKDTILKFIHLRYYPPGLILQYLDCQGRNKEKTIELLELNYSSNVSKISNDILKNDPLLFSTRTQKTALVDALTKLKERCLHDYGKRFVKQYSFGAHSSPVTTMCLSKDGTICITTSLADNSCSVWDLGGMRELAVLEGHSAPVTCLALNHFCDKAVSASEDGCVRVWDLPRIKNLSARHQDANCYMELSVTPGKIICADASSDFTTAASGCSDHIAYVHDLTNGIAMYRFANGHSLDITSIQFDVSGKTLLTGSLDSTAGLWDLRSGDLVFTLTGHKSGITNCLFDHLCQTIATSSLDSKVRIWDVRMLESSGMRAQNPSLLYEFDENDDEVLSIHFDSRGNNLASGSRDGTLTTWDVKTGALQFQIKNAHDAAINKVRWSPQGGLLMTASDDKSVHLYHPDMATCIQTLSHHKGPVTNACFSYSNEYLITTGEDKNVVIYRLENPLKNEPFVLSPIAIRSTKLSAR